jgi:hypothetical protein
MSSQRLGLPRAGAGLGLAEATTAEMISLGLLLAATSAIAPFDMALTRRLLRGCLEAGWLRRGDRPVACGLLAGWGRLR